MTTVAVESLPPDVAHPRLQGFTRLVRRMAAKKSTVVAFALLSLVVLAGVFAPWLAPYDHTETGSKILAPMSGEHWLGTDDVGRDLLSRLLYAVRFSLVASLFAVGVAVLLGTAIGLVSGYVGGWFDNVLMRITDAILAFPGLLLAMGIVGILGPGVRNAMLGLAIAFTPTFVRLVRGEVLQVRAEPFVEAAEVAGVKPRRIIWRHVLPNVRSALIVQIFMTMALALLAEGALSFLGLGVQPPEASLGSLLQRGFNFVQVSMRPVLIPGLVITLLAWCFNALADGLRDALDVTDSEELSI